MSIQYFTKYLGAQVEFTHKPYEGYEGDVSLYDTPLGDLVVTVQGVIAEVLITQDLEDCQFVLDGEFYRFDSVNFISELLISEELS